MTFAGFNRRMRKTARPVVWKGYGVQLPVPPSDPGGHVILLAAGGTCTQSQMRPASAGG